jgi:hypothetical protein
MGIEISMFALAAMLGLMMRKSRVAAEATNFT